MDIFRGRLAEAGAQWQGSQPRRSAAPTGLARRHGPVLRKLPDPGAGMAALGVAMDGGTVRAGCHMLNSC